jgi:hypothetical protein
MNQLPKILTFLFATLLTSIVLAQDPPKSRAEAEALVASLKYQEGTIDLRHGLASPSSRPVPFLEWRRCEHDISSIVA